MIDLQEINDAIVQLEHGVTTYSALERLSVLYTVRDRLTSGENPEQIESMGYSFAEPKSEFREAVEGIPVEDVYKIIDEHMEAVKSVYPKEYEAVLRMIREL